MKNKIYILAFFIMGSLVVCGQVTDQSNQIILKLKNEVNDFEKLFKHKLIGNEKIDKLNLEFNANKIKRQSLGINSNQYIYVILFPNETNMQQVLDAYNNTGEVEYAEMDAIGSGGGKQEVVPNDQHYGRQWALKNDGSFTLSTATAGADINMEKAWDKEQGDSNIIMAIIDSGTKLDHTELNGRIWKNLKEIPNNGKDDDKNGYIDDVQGWDFANSDNSPMDDHGHGTNVVGIIGTNGNNSNGYVGVDWNCKLMVLKSLDNANRGFYTWFADAIYYAVDNGARVINMSLGGSSISTTLENAIKYALAKNVVIVVCMMNTNSSTLYYPAAYDGVIAVGSTNPDDTRSSPFFWGATSGSNYGGHISVVAPGNYMYGLNHTSSTKFDSYWGGTSQATPLVAGLASLLLAQDTSRTPAQVKAIIENTAEDEVGKPSEDTPGWDQYYGYGRINAFAALSTVITTNTHQIKKETLKVFPNPTNLKFTVEFPKSAKQVQITNSLGQIVLIRAIEGETSQDFELAEAGIYFVQITTNRQTITKKIIVCK